MSFLTPDDEFELYEIISATADYMDLLSGTSKLPWNFIQILLIT